MYDFSGKEWGLVLAGGGGKGAYQIGVFRALTEKLIDNYITAVSGTSVGALNLILFAYNDLKLAEKIWCEISPDSFLEVSPEMIDFKEGLVSRKGLTDILDNYIDMEVIRKNERTLYVNATDFGKSDTDNGTSRYFLLNYKASEEIKKILLASSAMPVIYSPVMIGNNVFRDGGITDNLPIEPLYIEGIRHFIVVGLSTETEINYERYSDAEFLFIKPEKSIGEFWNGTLDFTSKGAKIRMEIGYMDAIRKIEFYNRDDELSQMLYQASVEQDYNSIAFECKKSALEEQISDEKDKIQDIINKYDI